MAMLSSKVRLPAALVLTALLGGCSLFASGPRLETLSGQLTSEEPEAMPDQARVEVRLIDLKEGRTTLATADQRHPGDFPIDFNLRYDAGSLEQNGRYVLDAAIREGGQLRYINIEPLPLPDDESDRTGLEIPMERVN